MDPLSIAIIFIGLVLCGIFIYVILSKPVGERFSKERIIFLTFGKAFSGLFVGICLITASVVRSELPTMRLMLALLGIVAILYSVFILYKYK